MNEVVFFILLLIISAIGAFMGAYFRKKGENFATKEDIAEITKRIEEVRSIYNEQLESFKASLDLSNQLKLAALDERLQKHQEAHSLWLNLIRNLEDDEEIGPVLCDCNDWWDKNSLYLGADARGAFKTASHLAGQYRHLDSRHEKEKRKWFEDILAAGEKIVKGVELPSLGEDEIKSSDPDKGKGVLNLDNSDP